ncbi:hypothetical protein GLYMA_18G152550v4 [Glycine max]|nr:hypothetical protein GLYMA_18G152550v4 [Glycine max]KAH1154645.1 hypothetical protein GYH30_050077 [Glycine max]
MLVFAEIYLSILLDTIFCIDMFNQCFVEGSTMCSPFFFSWSELMGFTH